MNKHIVVKIYSISLMIAMLGATSTSTAFDTPYSLSTPTYTNAPNKNINSANSNFTNITNTQPTLKIAPTEYVCYKFIQQYLSGSNYNNRCDNFTGYCTRVHTPAGYLMRTRAQCIIQTKPCKGEWSQYAAFSQGNTINYSVGPVFGFRKYPGADPAQAAFIRCVNEPVTVRPR